MLLLLKLALRNLTRNHVRTFLNLTMVVGAFVSILLFKGFSNYILRSIEEGLTTGQLGHIQVATSAMWNGDSLKNKEQPYLADHKDIENKISLLPGVAKVSGRANAQVLISNGDKTVGGFALGFDPRVEDNIEKALQLRQGQGFSKTQDSEILVGSGLQKSLQLQMGQTVSVVSQTLAGSMSSLELEVRGVVSSGFIDIDNSTVYIPLAAAQKLLGTERVEKIAVLLKSGNTLSKSLADIQNIIKDKPELIAKDWKELSLLFRQITDFYAIQNLVVEMILSILIFLGILNTLGMSIYERIGEIGTMRALGDQKSEILSLLVCEGLFLGGLGALVGAPTAWLLAQGFSSLNIHLVMPGASLPMPIFIEPHWENYLEASFAVVLTCLISSLWPAQKAIRLSIVDALRANS